MKHNNISIFIPHIGCPNKCSFCNQKSITGKCNAPQPEDVKKICRQAFEEISDKANTEIAFFGGSFTAINKSYMIDLLKCVQEFIGENKFKGIRISTRPDCIEEEKLSLLKKYNVTSIELGAQSMDDNVLSCNDRGHSANDVVLASEMIKSYDFELGLQMMLGLYKSTPELDFLTAKEIIKLKPDTVRIYPVVILENTKLGELFSNGIYNTYSLETAVDLSSNLIEMFEEHNIKILKLGLHASELVESEMLGGLYHPAFKELCENKIFFNKILSLLIEKNIKECTIMVAENAVSKAIVQNRKNIIELEKKGFKIKIKPSCKLKKYDLKIIEEEVACT